MVWYSRIVRTGRPARRASSSTVTQAVARGVVTAGTHG